MSIPVANTESFLGWYERHKPAVVCAKNFNREESRCLRSHPERVPLSDKAEKTCSLLKENCTSLIVKT